MKKLEAHELEYLINVALDTKDEEMFKDIMQRQEENKMLDFPLEPVKEQSLPFAAKEREVLVSQLEKVINRYKNRPLNNNGLYEFLSELENVINESDERLMDQAFKESGAQALQKPLEFYPAPMIAVSYETAMESFTKYGFPNETLDQFVERYFFGNKEEGNF